MAKDAATESKAVAPVIWKILLKVPAHYAMVPVKVFKWDDEKKELKEVTQ